MRDPNYQPRGEQPEVRPPGAEEAARDITRDAKAFTAAIRNRIFTFLRALISGEGEQALESIASSADADGGPWTADALAPGAGRIPRDARTHPPRSRKRAMCATPTSSPSEDKQPLARPADAHRPRRGERLGRGVRGRISPRPAPTENLRWALFASVRSRDPDRAVAVSLRTLQVISSQERAGPWRRRLWPLPQRCGLHLGGFLCGFGCRGFEGGP